MKIWIRYLMQILNMNISLLIIMLRNLMLTITVSSLLSYCKNTGMFEYRLMCLVLCSCKEGTKGMRKSGRLCKNMGSICLCIGLGTGPMHHINIALMHLPNMYLDLNSNSSPLNTSYTRKQIDNTNNWQYHMTHYHKYTQH